MIETAVILAAGKGSKIWPYCDTWPKAALPIANKSILQWQVEALRACGVKNILVAAGHLSGQVNAIAQELGVSCLPVTKIGGTASSLECMLAHVRDEAFAVINGDAVFAQEDLQALLAAPVTAHEMAALVQPLMNLSSQEWLCANAEAGRVKAIIGHPREASHRLCGLYTLHREFIPFLTTNPGFMTSVEVGNMPPQEAELAESLSRFVQKGGSLHAIETQRFFVDVDKPWHLLDANSAMLDYLGQKISGNVLGEGAVIESGAEIGGHVVMGRNSFIGHDVKMKDNAWIGDNTRVVDGAIIGENCSVGSNSVVREYCRIEANSSIGNHCIVGHAAEFGGILMDGAYSYHYGEYWGVIGRSADLGAATVCGNLRFDDQTTQHVIKGRRETPSSNAANAAYLGDYTRTGVNTILMPGVKVGPYSVIGAGVILYEDVPNNTLVYVKQDLIKKSWGPEKYGW